MNDQSEGAHTRGIFDSLRALIDSVVAILHNRAELVATEIQEELTRFVGVLLWALVAVQAAIMGVILVGVTILIGVPAGYRVWTAAGLALVFLILAGAGGLTVRKLLRAKPRPFDASLTELEKDRERLRGGR